MVPKELQSSAYHTMWISQSQASDRQYHAATRHSWQILGNKHHVLAVFIDIAKAYDMVCTDTLLLKLLKMGTNRRMFNFIRSFLTNRSFQVRVGSKLSMVKYPTNGIPQGSILSPVLFSIVI